MKEKTPVLKEVYHISETIDENGIYRKYKWRTIEKIGFYIRPIREWFYPCKKCQVQLKKLLANGTWILGNKQYEPAIELNSVDQDVDENYEEVLEERKATKEEIEDIGIEGWREVE